MSLETDDRREINGWSMYDWANSAFYTTVITTFLGPYLANLAEARGGTVDVLGFSIHGNAFYPFLFAVSILLQVSILPILGAIADFTALKKRLMMGFAYCGAAATCLLFFVTEDRILFGGLVFIIANLCFGSALVFYNSFLPLIASPQRRDAVSSQGFAMGYLGGAVLLLVNLGLFAAFDDEHKGLAVRINLASAGVWWLAFTWLFPRRLLRERAPEHRLPAGESYFSHSIRQLRSTLRDLWKKNPRTLQFLIAYLIYNDAIQTVIVVSGQFATQELKIDAGQVVQVVLMIQIVAFFGSLLFNQIARIAGAKLGIILSLIIWIILVLYAYFFLASALQFWILGFVLGLILGGSQALSRSLFSQMIPRQREAEYFSLYEISDRGVSWIGQLVFGLAVQMTGQQRLGILSLIVFFVIGLLVLILTDVQRAIREAGQQPAAAA